MQRHAIVDLGSNTARLVVFAYEPGVWFRLADQIREPVRLAENLATEKGLSKSAIERGAAALRLYSEYQSAMNLESLDVFATSAVRDAVNRDEFFERIQGLNLSVRLLPSREEARLGVDAVANGFALEHGWVMDLGGGSLQISRMRRREFDWGRSFPLGAVRMTEAYLKSDPPKRSQIAKLEEAVESHLAPTADRIRRKDHRLIAMGGSIRNLARAVQKERGYPLPRLHGYFLERDALDRLTDHLSALSAKQRSEIPGIKPDRGDIILGAALVYRWLLREANLNGVLISGQGVREGAFFKVFLPPPHRIPDIRQFSSRNFFRQYPQSETHTRQVRFLAGRLFEELSSLHGLRSQDAELLDVAALLHDVGMAVGYHNHHKHGAYLLTSSQLSGFSHREQALLIRVIRFHRKGMPTWGYLSPLAEPGDKRRLLILTTCLRLAEYLERARGGRIRDVKAEITRTKVKLILEASEAPYVEIWETRKQAPLFKRAFKRKLVLEAPPWMGDGGDKR